MVKQDVIDSKPIVAGKENINNVFDDNEDIKITERHLGSEEYWRNRARLSFNMAMEQRLKGNIQNQIDRLSNICDNKMIIEKLAECKQRNKTKKDFFTTAKNELNETKDVSNRIQAKSKTIRKQLNSVKKLLKKTEKAILTTIRQIQNIDYCDINEGE